MGRMFVGSTEIAEAYLGGTKVFERTAPTPRTVYPSGSYGGVLDTTYDRNLASANVNAGDTIVLRVQLYNCINDWWASRARFRATLGSESVYVDVPSDGNTWSSAPVSTSFVANTTGTVMVQWLTADNPGTMVSTGSNGRVYVG